MHVRACEGFCKVGLGSSLTGGEDVMICREAKQFWDELNMVDERERAITTVREEWHAGRLTWDMDTVYSLIVPFPEHTPTVEHTIGRRRG